MIQFKITVHLKNYVGDYWLQIVYQSALVNRQVSQEQWDQNRLHFLFIHLTKRFRDIQALMSSRHTRRGFRESIILLWWHINLTVLSACREQRYCAQKDGTRVEQIQ